MKAIILSGGLGNDLLDGGAELVYGDTASYIDRNEKITVDLDNSGNGTVTVGGAESDTLVDIENITVKTFNSIPLKIKDIANVILHHQIEEEWLI